MVGREAPVDIAVAQVQSQADVIHLVRSTGTIVSNHIYTLLKAALRKAD